MAQEDYVSFELAKLLKEKGFDWECRAFYVKSKECGIELFYSKEPYNYNNNVYPCTSAPTLQMARKWLRETFEIHCQIDCPIASSNWVYGIRDLNQDEWITLRNMGDYETYEEACENAIKYCLENLI